MASGSAICPAKQKTQGAEKEGVACQCQSTNLESTSNLIISNLTIQRLAKPVRCFGKQRKKKQTWKQLNLESRIQNGKVSDSIFKNLKSKN